MPGNDLVLVTGVSGVVGQALLAERHSDDVLGLVHQARPQATVPLVEGDLALPRLGLSADEYRALCGRIKAVVHSAALTSFTSPLEDIRRVNVDGTATMLRLAADAGVPLLYVSSAFSVLRHEDESPAHYAYVESKKRAEELVGESGLPAVIVRPSVTLGHSETGYISRFQVFHRMMAAILRGNVPMLPADPDGVIDFVAGEWVARSIWALLDEFGPGLPDTVWLTAGPQVTSVSKVLDIWFDFARRVGRPGDPPRVVDPDMVDRLIRAVFLEELPSRVARMFDGVLQITSLMTLDDQFPHSALPCLPPRPDSRRILLNNAAYWAVRTRFASPELIWAQAREACDAGLTTVGAQQP
jgi:nucleoside-diphosphate-sugar epimerase